MQELIVKESCKILRKNQDIYIVNSKNMEYKNDDNIRYILSIGKLHHFYYVYLNSLYKEIVLWMVLRNYKDDEGLPGYCLKLNDRIRFGKIRYLIKEFEYFTDDKQTNHNISYTVHDNEIASPTEPQIEKINVLSANVKPSDCLTQTGDKDIPICRICLSNENTENNALIKLPCDCIGSVQFMHILCMKRWFQSKVIERKTRCSITYTWNQFECEVCKFKFPGFLYLYEFK